MCDYIKTPVETLLSYIGIALYTIYAMRCEGIY